LIRAGLAMMAIAVVLTLPPARPMRDLFLGLVAFGIAGLVILGLLIAFAGERQLGHRLVRVSLLVGLLVLGLVAVMGALAHLLPWGRA
jgi:hypothetical protein